MIILFFINFQSIFSSSKNDIKPSKELNLESYEFLGIIIILLIFSKIFLYYIINLKQIIKYLQKVRASSKLIFFNNHYSEEYRQETEISSCKEEDYFTASEKSNSDYFGKIKDLENDKIGDRVQIDKEHYDKFFNYGSRSEDFTIESSDISGNSRRSFEKKK